MKIKKEHGRGKAFFRVKTIILESLSKIELLFYEMSVRK